MYANMNRYCMQASECKNSSCTVNPPFMKLVNTFVQLKSFKDIIWYEIAVVGMFWCWLHLEGISVDLACSLGHSSGSTAQYCTVLTLFQPATLCQAHQKELDGLQRLLDDHNERLKVIQQESNQLMNAQQTAEEDKHLDWVVSQYRGLGLFWGWTWIGCTWKGARKWLLYSMMPLEWQHCTVLHSFDFVSACNSLPGSSERAGRLAETAWWSQWATEGHPARIQPADECSTNGRGGQALGLGGEPISRVGVVLGLNMKIYAKYFGIFRCWLHLERGSEVVALFYDASRVAALHSTAQFWLCFRLQLFGRLIRKSWTACRDCLMITMSDWRSSSKNPTSWWMLNKRPRRTSTWIGWWANIEGWGCFWGWTWKYMPNTSAYFDVGCTWKGARKWLLYSMMPLEWQHCTVLHSFDFVSACNSLAGSSERAGRLAETAWWSQWATEGHPARIQPADECSTNSRGGHSMGLGGDPVDGCLDLDWIIVAGWP